jgi:hypothetical protein
VPACSLAAFAENATRHVQRIYRATAKCDAAATIVWQPQKNIFTRQFPTTGAGNALGNKKNENSCLTPDVASGVVNTVNIGKKGAGERIAPVLTHQVQYDRRRGGVVRSPACRVAGIAAFVPCIARLAAPLLR